MRINQTSHAWSMTVRHPTWVAVVEGALSAETSNSQDHLRSQPQASKGCIASRYPIGTIPSHRNAKLRRFGGVACCAWSVRRQQRKSSSSADKVAHTWLFGLQMPNKDAMSTRAAVKGQTCREFAAQVTQPRLKAISQCLEAQDGVERGRVHHIKRIGSLSDGSLDNP